MRFRLVWPLVVCSVEAGACFGPDPCPDVHFEQEVPVPATDTTLSLGTRVAAHTNPGSGPVEIAIDDDQGTMRIGGLAPIQAFVYEAIPWNDIQRTLYQGLAIEDGTWYPFWLYCTADGRLTEVYVERSDRNDALDVGASGTCQATTESFAIHLQIPAHGIRRIALTCGFDATDPSLPRSDSTLPTLDLASSRPGVMWRSDHWAQVLPFATVDCVSGCGSPASSWFEIHSIVWDAFTGDVGFGLWYLYPKAPTSGASVGSFSLPDASTWTAEFPFASWTIAH